MSQSENSIKCSFNSTSDSKSERGEKSTISACTAAGASTSNHRYLNNNTNQPNNNSKSNYLINHNDDPEIENQNLCNKRNEKLNKPCKNGFCYCFTSDSDDIRVAKTRRNRTKIKKPNGSDEYHNEPPRDINVFEKKRRATLPLQNRKNSPSKLCQRKSLNAYAILEEESNSNAPLIHIVQELHANKVISQVRVNKNKIYFKENYKQKIIEDNSENLFVHTEKKINDSQKSYEVKHQTENLGRKKPKTSEAIYECKRICKNSQDEIIPDLSYIVPKRRSSEKAGKLLKKRLSRNSKDIQEVNYSQIPPPKKPPRQPRSKIENLQQAEKVLDEFMARGKINSSRKSLRKTYPLENEIIFKNQSFQEDDSNKNLKLNPSCPSLSDFDVSDIDVKVGWVSNDVMQMLKTQDYKNFDSNQSKPGAQKLGWVKPAENIELSAKTCFQSENVNLTQPHKLDIDTVDGQVINDHNFIKNMESKDTPVKIMSNKLQSTTTADRSEHKLDTQRSSFREIAARETKTFFKNSKQKLVKFVGKTSKESLKQNLLMKNAAVQTSLIDVNDKSLHLNLGKDERFSDQSPPGSYHSPVQTDKIITSETQIRDEFDFDRNIKTPKSQLSNRKLNFSPKKIIQNLSFRNSSNIGEENSGAYKSYESEYNGDFSLTTMKDILLNIKSKLEASDEHAERTFEDVRRRSQQLNSKAPSNIDHSSKNDLLSVNDEIFVQINAQADIHNEPIYSEIEEDQIVVTGTPSIDGLNDISHYVVNNKDIYTEIKKTSKYLPKKINTVRPDSSHRSEPSETCVDNFIQENDDDKNVSYESPAEESYLDINQSTPNKNAMDTESVLMKAFPSISDIGYDIIEHNRSISCPPPIDSSKLNNNNILDDSISMPNNDNNIEKFKPLRYQNIKNKLRTSLRKGKFYFKNNSNKFKDSIQDQKNFNDYWEQSNLCIENLYNEPSIQLKLEKTVQILRFNPKLENTLEAVEAERLLLFSSLKNLRYTENTHCNDNKSSIIIKNFKFFITQDLTDIFFNYFYIGVFSSENRVKSTSLAVKNGKEILFQNCNLIFDKLHKNSVIKCDIYILRLRRILNSETNTKMNNSSIIEMKPSNTFTSLNDLESRFKLHATFSLSAHNFVPFQLKNEDMEDKKFCLNTENDITIPIEIISTKTSLDQFVSVYANLKIYFDKFFQEGFLNVQDLNKKHNWNRRWCKLNIFNLEMWNYPQDSNEKNPIDSFDLIKCINLELASKEVCARPRSFIINFFNDNDIKLQVIFAADNQSDLKIWMTNLNQILDFIRVWIRVE